MDRTKYTTVLFLSGALWNWAVSVALFLVSVLVPGAFVDLGMQVPNTMVWFHCTVGFVGVFGVVYFIAYKDKTARRGIALSGVVEKLFIFTVLLAYFFAGDIGAVGVGLIAVDFVYGVLFLELYVHAPAA